MTGTQNSAIRHRANAIGVTLIAFLALQYAVVVAAVTIAGLFTPNIGIYGGRLVASDMAAGVINIISAAVCYAAPVALLASLLRMTGEELIPHGRVRPAVYALSAGVTLGSSVVGSFTAILLSLLLGGVGLTPRGPELAVPDTPLMLIIALLSTAVLPAVFEELLFRGAILGALRRFGDTFALAASTLLFGLLHRNLVQLPNALLTGAVLGFLAIRTGSLIVPMFCHFVNNAMSVVTQYVTLGMDEQEVGTLVLSANGLYLLVGAASLALLLRAGELTTSKKQEGAQGEKGKSRAFFGSLPVIAVVLYLAGSIVVNMLP